VKGLKCTAKTPYIDRCTMYRKHGIIVQTVHLSFR